MLHRPHSFQEAGLIGRQFVRSVPLGKAQWKLGGIIALGAFGMVSMGLSPQCEALVFLPGTCILVLYVSVVGWWSTGNGVVILLERVWFESL
jgi:hypothetical protein